MCISFHMVYRRLLIPSGGYGYWILPVMMNILASTKMPCIFLYIFKTLVVHGCYVLQRRICIHVISSTACHMARYIDVDVMRTPSLVNIRTKIMVGRIPIFLQVDGQRGFGFIIYPIPSAINFAETNVEMNHSLPIFFSILFTKLCKSSCRDLEFAGWFGGCCFTAQWICDFFYIIKPRRFCISLHRQWIHFLPLNSNG